MLTRAGSRSVRGEQYNKVIVHPANEATREEWLDKLALACDSDESDESDEEEEKAPADDVVASAKEYDAVQLLSSEETEEREVRSRLPNLHVQCPLSHIDRGAGGGAFYCLRSGSSGRGR